MISPKIADLCFWLSIACFLSLVVGIMVEYVSGYVLFEGYISTFLGWTLIFAAIEACRSTSKASKQ